ncbi:MAG: TauD/TfdA family dioxygenase, partial [bacterium]
SRTVERYARYTERKHNVIWNKTAAIRQGISALKSLLHSDKQWVSKVTLQPGQGLICNNVFHNRSAFQDEDNGVRCLQRIRFSQRICLT